MGGGGSFLGIGGSEFLLLVILAVIMFGPERIPEFSRKAARVIYYLRNVANNATGQLKQELGPEYQDLTIEDLNPKTFIQKRVLDELQADIDSIKGDIGDVKSELNSVSGLANSAIGDINAAANSAVASASGADGQSGSAVAPETPGATKTQWGFYFDPEAT